MKTNCFLEMENTNKAIVVNSLVLYAKMIITVLCSVFTTRFALQALGVVDFGLYSLLGGIISFIIIFNTIMIKSSQRFMAIAIGKGNVNDANVQFNVNLIIHASIAILTILVAYPIGKWYIYNYINYDGDLSIALLVFIISIVGAVISFIGVPYNALIIAKEKFVVFSVIDVISQIGKLVIAYLLTIYFINKLVVYSVSLAVLTALPTFVYVIYCQKNYISIVKIKFVRDLEKYKEIFFFSIWVSIGAVCMIGKNQGASIIINLFFNTIMNTALGIANNIGGFINMFSHNVTQPMSPQITKSYAAHDFKRMDQLLTMSTKFGFLFMLFASSPFLISSEWILNLWLGQVPSYSTMFLKLMIIDCLLLSFNDGLSNAIFASGEIKSYQITTSMLNLLSVVFGFVVLKLGAPAYSLLLVYIGFSFIRVVAVQIILSSVLNFDYKKLVKNSYLPSMIVVVLFSPVTFVDVNISPFLKILFFMVYLCLLILFIGLNSNERNYLKLKVQKLYKKKKEYL